MLHIIVHLSMSSQNTQHKPVVSCMSLCVFLVIHLSLWVSYLLNGIVKANYTPVPPSSVITA